VALAGYLSESWVTKPLVGALRRGQSAATQRGALPDHSPEVLHLRVLEPSSVRPGRQEYSADEGNLRCRRGYRVKPASMALRKCSPSGEWLGEPATCVGIRVAPLPNILNARVRSNSTFYPAGMTVVCKGGFAIQGKANVDVSKDGSWPTGGLPSCVPVECKKPSAPAAGKVRITSSFFPSNATYTCSEGYNLKGSAMRRCTKTGKWEGEAPVCEGVPCRLPRTIENGNVVTTSEVYPSKAVYGCFPGFKLSSPAPRICSTEGKWLGPRPQCAAICPKAPAPAMGNVTQTSDTYPSVATYSCAAGCKRFGVEKQECTNKGKWESETPKCKCLNYFLSPVGTKTVLGGEPTVTLYVNGRRKRAAMGAADGWCSAAPGDTIAVSVTGGSTNAFIGAFKSSGTAFATSAGASWKCDTKHTPGWEEVNFRVPSSFVDSKEETHNLPRDMSPYPNAHAIKGASDGDVFCRFTIPK